VIKLDNTVMGYDWGSRTAIAALQGRRVPSDAPEAELWIGAHASAPSRIRGGDASLAERIARSPESELGADIRARFGDRMPFLLKVLAADVPLSLQAHPDAEQARRGHAREEALGIPVSARNRCYRDASHKPEVLCALGPFEALCGFRPFEETLAVVEALAVPSLAALMMPLRRAPSPAALRECFETLMTLEPASARSIVDAVAAACRREAAGGGPGSAHLAWVARLAQLHPGDTGVVASLLLNHVRLEAGEAVALRAGLLHSYLAGTGIELMASSDNVLRGGLTTKHVDCAELVAILDFRPSPCRPVEMRRLCEHESEYVTGTADFRLSTIVVTDGAACRPPRRGPELLLCIEGAATVTTDGGDTEPLGKGESVFVSASDARYAISGTAKLFRATAGDPLDDPAR
jgi:mannose-6-phosphate isomerase